MNVVVTVGDVLDAAADVLISTANPWLNMSGGVNGAIRERCDEIQAELRAHLDSITQTAVPAGTVVRTSAGPLPFCHIIHAVAIDPFYDSSSELVASTLTAAFELACSLGARTVSLPTLATGYGPVTMSDFARAFATSVVDQFDLDSVTLVVRSEETADTIGSVLGDCYFFSCGFCSHTGFYARLADTPSCIKCGRDPIQYRKSDNVYCYLHRAEMPSTYATTSQFLLTEFVWRGQERRFPNARIYAVGEVDDSADDVQRFPYCEKCQSAYEEWIASR